MAELACLASIVQLADVGARVALTLFTIADNVKNAAVDARLVATDLSLFAACLRSLGKNLNKRLETDEALQRMTKCLLKSCQVVITELSTLVNGCDPSTSQRGKLFAGFKWTWKQSRIGFLRSSLESLKSTILLLIASVDLVDTPSSSPAETTALQAQMVNMMKVSESATADLLGKAQDQAHSEQDATDHSDAVGSLALVSNDSAQFAEDNDIRVGMNDTNGRIDPRMGKLVLRSSNALIPLGPAAIDLQAQQLVYKFAGNLLIPDYFEGEPAGRPFPYRESERRWPPNERHSRTTSASKHPHGRPGTQRREQWYSEHPRNLPDDSDSGSDAADAEKPEGHNSLGSDEILRRLSELLAERNYPTDRKSAARGTPQRPSDDSPDQVRARRTSPGKQREHEEDWPKLPIRFKDAVGRKFTFPFHLVKTWRGMEELIKQAFLHVDIIGQHVQEGHYDLFSPEGEIILPQVWETVIQPDMLIEMKMWPLPEKPFQNSPKASGSKIPPRGDLPPPPPSLPQPDPWSSEEESLRPRRSRDPPPRRTASRSPPPRTRKSKKSPSSLAMWLGTGTASGGVSRKKF